MLGSQIAALLQPIKMSFRNERITQSSNLPYGLYWGVYLGNERNGAWKIDLWVVSPAQYEKLATHNERIVARLTERSRRHILQIKALCWQQPDYRRRFTSQDIYDAVLDHGVRDMAEFERYLQNKG